MTDELKIEYVAEPPNNGYRKNASALRIKILEAPVGQWMKITGFADKKALRVTQMSVNANARTVGGELRGQGIKLITRTNGDELALYLCKKLEAA